MKGFQVLGEALLLSKPFGLNWIGFQASGFNEEPLCSWPEGLKV